MVKLWKYTSVLALPVAVATPTRAKSAEATLKVYLSPSLFAIVVKLGEVYVPEEALTYFLPELSPIVKVEPPTAGVF